MRVLKENLQLEQPFGSGQALVRAEGTLMLPGNDQDVTILYKTARLELASTEVQTGRIVSDGMVYFTVLYLDAEGKAVSIEAETGINAVIEIEGAASRMRPSVWGIVEGVEAQESGGRLTLRADVSLEACVVDTNQIAVVADVEDISQVVKREETIVPVVQGGSGRQRMLLSESFDLEREDARILFAQARAEVSNAQAGEHSVMADGAVYVQIALATNGAPPYFTMNQALPFSVSMDVQGARFGMEALAQASAQELVCELVQTETEKGIRVECILQLEAQVYQGDEITLLSDVFSTGDEILETSAQEERFTCGVQAYSQNQSISQTVELPGNTGAIWGVQARPVAVNYIAEENQFVAEGVLEVTVLYDGDGLRSVVEEIPFHFAFSPVEYGCGMHLDVVSAQASAMGAGRAEVQLGVKLGMTQYALCTQAFLTDVVQADELYQRPDGITLYYPSQGEDLWDVAKRYHMSLDELAVLNPSAEGPVLIYRKQTDFE